MVREMRKDLVKEQYKRETQAKISSILNMASIILSMQAT
jgi:hypothetical protein